MTAWYSRDANGVSLELAVRPKAPKIGLGPATGGRLKVRVAEPDQNGRANDAVVRLLAKKLGVRKDQVRILTGRRNRRKTVRVDADVDQELLDRLEQGELK